MLSEYLCYHIHIICNILGTISFALGLALFLGVILYSVNRKTPLAGRFQIGIAATVLLLLPEFLSPVTVLLSFYAQQYLTGTILLEVLFVSLRSLFVKVAMLLFFWGILSALWPKSGPNRKLLFGGLAVGALAISVLLSLITTIWGSF